MQQKIPFCPKHEKQALYVCSFQSCREHRLLCEICKQKQTLHFSNHANYIHKYEKVKEFDNAKKTIPQLEKGIVDCENFVIEHKKFYMQQIQAIRDDFSTLQKQFTLIVSKYEEIYAQSFQREIEKFDQEINNVKRVFKEYIKQKNQQDSFFTLLFQTTQTDKSDEFGLEALIKKNSKAFKVRADIINLRTSIAMSKNNQVQYKKTEEDQRRLLAIHEELDFFTRALFDKFKDILAGDAEANDNLKSSIINESKQLALSKVSLGNLITLESDLRRSQASNSSERSIQRVPLPALNPVVASTRQKLKPLEQKNKPNIIFEGPYLYSTGVYFGQFQNNKRSGWGQFVFKDGSIYEGEWEKDTIQGFGRLIRNDCYYEGNVKNGKANGAGNYEDFYRYYTGEWKNDKRNGTGEEEIKNKSRKYVGTFVDDKYNGRGKLTTEQYIYEGKFKDGLFHEDGKIKYFNGETFEGTFVDGEKYMGRQTYPDGSYYDGMFKDNLPNGTGQFYWADGLRFHGQWKSGVQEGIGIQIHQDGRELKGLWKNGRWEKWL